MSSNIKSGRNDPCRCGSGKKIKHCCGLKQPLNPLAKSRSAILETQLVHLFGAARYAEVENVSRALLALQPESPLAWTMLGQSMWVQGKDAMQALEKTARLLPDDAGVQANLATALLARGQPKEALKLYRRALHLRPDFAEGHNNLGSALRDLGELMQAAASYRHALSLKPDFAVAHCNLGHVLRLQGDLANAVQHYQAATALQPELADAHTGLGNALQDLGQCERALESHRRSAQLKPSAAESFFCMGNALLDLWRSEEAERCYRRAIELRPDYVEAHDKLSVAFRQQGRVAESESSCRRALDFNPNFVDALINFAQLAADRGDFPQAESTLRRAIELHPQSPEAMTGIAGLRKMTVADAAWAEQAEQMASVTKEPRRKARIRYALGKYFDDVGDAKKAYDNYRSANELSKVSSTVHDREHLERQVDRVISLFGRDWCQSHCNVDNDSTRPVLVVGMPRSGTTLVEQILGAHPAIRAAGELPFWVPELQRYLDAPDAAAQGAMSLQPLAAAYLQLLDQTSTTAAHVVDKMPANFMCLALIQAAFPHARLIHVVRHPVDTCLSVYFQDFSAAHTYATDLDDTAHYYRQYRRVMSHWRETLPPGVMLEISYEELVADQETWSRRLLEFVGVQWDPRCLEFQEVNRSAGTILTFSQWQARQKINRNSVARWQKYEPYIAPLLPLAREFPSARAGVGASGE